MHLEKVQLSPLVSSLHLHSMEIEAFVHIVITDTPQLAL